MSELTYCFIGTIQELFVKVTSPILSAHLAAVCFLYIKTESTFSELLFLVISAMRN